MYPRLKEGQKCLCTRFFFTLKPKELLIFKNPISGEINIKQLRWIKDERLFVEGLDPQSVDSSVYGLLSKKDILYKVLFVF
jgi:hypothetical protein